MEPFTNNLIRILYAEDDSDDQEFFQDCISEAKLNCSLMIFNDGYALLKFLDKNRYKCADIIFVDINMPLISGKQCVREIRQNPKLDHIPIIILSTSTLEVNELLEAGANLFISKTIVVYRLAGSPY
jgi:CheY-like chemotaxis protein